MTARFWILLLLIAALVAGGIFVFPRLEGSPPEIASDVGEATLQVGRAPRGISVTVRDPRSGLRSAEAHILAGDVSQELAQQHFPGSFTAGGRTEAATLDLSLDAESLGLEDGPATLVIRARDWSMRDGLDGNQAEQRIALVIDTSPPRVDVESGLTYVHRGGSAAVVYRLGEEVAEHGVRVGDAFFPGHPATGGGRDALDRIAIFAIPVEAPRDPSVRVVARDAAGNESSADFPVRVVERDFGSSEIRLSQGFLERKVRPLAESNGLAGRDLAESFQRVNETLRTLNEERIRSVVDDASGSRHWQGAFEQMRNSQVTSHFAERRTYLWEGRPVSKAIHYGFDLASTSGAPVTASNAGVVAFADELGIYGRCVIIDHGLGVHSLYGHLSRMDVKSGDRVERGQELGRSGATGLAGGDHLHFAILVGGVYVDPLEWWDPKWVRSHIEWRLDPGAEPRG